MASATTGTALVLDLLSRHPAVEADPELSALATLGKQRVESLQDLVTDAATLYRFMLRHGPAVIDRVPLDDLIDDVIRGMTAERNAGGPDVVRAEPGVFVRADRALLTQLLCTVLATFGRYGRHRLISAATDDIVRLRIAAAPDDLSAARALALPNTLQHLCQAVLTGSGCDCTFAETGGVRLTIVLPRHQSERRPDPAVSIAVEPASAPATGTFGML